MDKKLYFFKSVNGYVKIAFAVSLITVISMELWLYDIPEFFTKGHELGNILYNICMSTIAGTIFYILTYHYKEFREKDSTYPYVKLQLSSIVSLDELLFSELAKNTSTKLTEHFPDEKELQNICTKLNPDSDAPIATSPLSKNSNWWFYFNDHCTRSRQHIDSIFKQTHFLEPDLIKILVKFSDNTFFRELNLMRNVYHEIRDFRRSHKSNLLSYISLLKEIDRYLDKRMRYY